MAELDQIYKSLYILFVGMARQVAKKMWDVVWLNVIQGFVQPVYYALKACHSRLGLVPPWIVACPIPLVPAHLLNSIFCPEKGTRVAVRTSNGKTHEHC
jgi:hypothetical protein